MKLIIETDLGHDPDDFFAICYLIAAGVDIKAIIVQPGDLDQIAIAKLLCDETYLDIPVLAGKYSNKMSSGSIHHDLLKKYKRTLTAKPDDVDIRLDPTFDFLIIGPPKLLGQHCANGFMPRAATMQGGFCPYSIYFPANPVCENMVGQNTMPTFNMNGAITETLSLIDAPIKEKRFIGKNVCHTIIFDHASFSNMSRPTCRASELFMEAMQLYLTRHDSKKFHDPVAAVCHLHPEIGTWTKGKPFRSNGKWGTELRDDGDNVLVDMDREKFWHHIYNFT